MPKSKTRYVQVALNVSKKERDMVNQLASQRGYERTSDYLRDLIERDATEHKLPVKFEVERGGDRKSPQYRNRTA